MLFAFPRSVGLRVSVASIFVPLATIAGAGTAEVTIYGKTYVLTDDFCKSFAGTSAYVMEFVADGASLSVIRNGDEHTSIRFVSDQVQVEVDLEPLGFDGEAFSFEGDVPTSEPGVSTSLTVTLNCV